MTEDMKSYSDGFIGKADFMTLATVGLNATAMMRGLVVRTRT
jgi:hypothetical protein